MKELLKSDNICQSFDSQCRPILWTMVVDRLQLCASTMALRYRRLS